MFTVILSIFFLSITGIAAFIMFLNYILNKIFHLPHAKSQKTPADFNLDHKELFVTSKHHKKIQIWDINPDSNSIPLIAVHGWANTSDSFLPMASELAGERRVLLLNTRNHGGSEDEKYMTLVKYAEDIRALIDHLQTEGEEPLQVHVLGHSLGGAAALWEASKDDRVKSVVTIGTFADLEIVMRNGFVKNKLFKGFVGSLFAYIEFRIGERMETISPQNSVNLFKGPVLLTHGTKDEVADFTDLNKIRKAANRETVEQFVMKGFGHSDLLVNKDLAQAIDGFIRKYD